MKEEKHGCGSDRTINTDVVQASQKNGQPPKQW